MVSNKMIVGGYNEVVVPAEGTTDLQTNQSSYSFMRNGVLRQGYQSAGILISGNITGGKIAMVGDCGEATSAELGIAIAGRSGRAHAGFNGVAVAGEGGEIRIQTEKYLSLDRYGFAHLRQPEPGRAYCFDGRKIVPVISGDLPPHKREWLLEMGKVAERLFSLGVNSLVEQAHLTRHYSGPGESWEDRFHRIEENRAKNKIPLTLFGDPEKRVS